jgi:hypothetical protein
MKGKDIFCLQEEKAAYLKMILSVPEDIVDDCGVSANIQKHSVVLVSEVVDRKGTVPSK